jgi:hypothetical protein
MHRIIVPPTSSHRICAALYQSSPHLLLSNCMRLLRYIATGFINFFSITQPSPEEENRTAIYIAIMLASVLAFVVVVITLAAHILNK